MKIKEGKEMMRTGAFLVNNIMKPMFYFIPKTIRSRIYSLNGYEVVLVTISRFFCGLFLGSTFPDFFRKHRIKILFISIISALPVCYKIFYDGEN